MIEFAAGVAAGAATAWWWSTRRGRPSHDTIERWADDLGAVEQMWRTHGVGVAHSINANTGVTDITIRVAHCGEDVTFTIDRPGMRRRLRPIDETVGVAKELPPGLRGDA